MNTFEDFEAERKKTEEILQGKIDKLRAKNKWIIIGEVVFIAFLFGCLAAAHAMNVDPESIKVIRNVCITTSVVSIGFTFDAYKKNVQNMMFHILNRESSRTNGMKVNNLKKAGKGIEDADFEEVTTETLEEYAKRKKI